MLPAGRGFSVKCAARTPQALDIAIHRHPLSDVQSLRIVFTEQDTARRGLLLLHAVHLQRVTYGSRSESINLQMRCHELNIDETAVSRQIWVSLICSERVVAGRCDAATV